MASLRTLDTRVIPTAQAFVQLLGTEAFARFAGVRRVVVTVTSARRDMATQNRLWDCYQRYGCSNCAVRPGSPRCFPAARPGHSPHGVGIAFDLHLDPDLPRVYAAAGAIWEALGLRWGGRFKDPIHFDAYPRGYVPPE